MLEWKRIVLADKARVASSHAVTAKTVYGVFSADAEQSSRFLACMAGAEAPLSGEILLDGHAISSRRARIGYLPAGAPFPGESTPAELLELVARVKGVKPSDRFLAIGEVLAFAELSHKKQSLISSLSAAERIRLGIAQAWLGSPDVLILDCIASGLPASDIRAIKRMVRRLAERGACVLLSLARPSDLFGMADRFLIVENGEVTPPLSRADVLSGSTLSLTLGRSSKDAESFLLGLHPVRSCRAVERSGDEPLTYLVRSCRSGIAETVADELRSAGFDLLECREEPLGESERILRRACVSSTPTAKEETK